MSVFQIQNIRKGKRLAAYRPILLMILALAIVFGPPAFPSPSPPSR